jgi:hypothetical protein
VLSVAALVRSEQTDPRWRQLEKASRAVREGKEIDRFNEEVLSPFSKLRRDALRSYDDQVAPVIDQNPSRRDPAAVAKALAALADGEGKFREAQDLLAKGGPYTSPRVVRVQEAGKEWMGEWLKLIRQSEDYLRKGENRTEQDEQALRDQRQRVDEARERWEASFQEK